MKRLFLLIPVALILAGCSTQTDMAKCSQSCSDNKECEWTTKSVCEKLDYLKNEIITDTTNYSSCSTLDGSPCYTERLPENINEIKHRLILLEDYLGVEYRPSGIQEIGDEYIKK